LLANILKYLFFFFIVKPYIYLGLGINVTGVENLYKVINGPCIIVANHNSHVDTLLLMSLFSCSQILNIHPLAAADYFFNTKTKSFIFKNLLGVIPIPRKIKMITANELFKDTNEVLQKGHSIIIYPEGTRGEDADIKKFHTGVAHIAKMNPEIPVLPVYINGPDRILPKGSILWIPFISDIYISEPILYDNTSTKAFTQKIQNIIEGLKAEHARKTF